MMRRIELQPGQRLTDADLARSGGVDAEIIGVAARIVDDVRQRGDVALREYTLNFDKAAIESFLVTPEEIETAVGQVEPEFLDALATAAGAIEDFHKRQIPQSWFTTQEGGVFLGQKVTPLRRVGIYVPGGRAKYPSSVLMNAIPAFVAGVDEVAMVVPPAADGSVNPYTLAAAAEAGVDEIYKVGGAQAVAALAYGTDSIPRVDKVVGPGNAYVTAAKKLVMGDVGIDMLAGPSEVLVLADETAVPAFVAIDLMAQAEHDPRAATYLVTTDPELPDLVEAALAELIAESPRGEITARSLADNGLVVVCPDIVAALDTVDLIAPEHLEVQMAEPFDLLGSIRNAGAIFLGQWTPESVGDYVAGPNHVLPTGGTARFSSPLSVDDFIKKSSVLSYSYEALAMDSDSVLAIADKEGLWAHGRAVSLRLEAVESFVEMDEADTKIDLGGAEAARIEFDFEVDDSITEDGYMDEDGGA
ncbi:MAG: histidinol dehydrogenase [Coriobacteriia bacterium]|nr:histidinol dehydrogenase [Coriobacteriia bacterium]